MTRDIIDRDGPEGMLAALSADLARDDRALSGIVPCLSHILANPGKPLVSDDVVARMHGFLADIVRHLVSPVDEETVLLGTELASYLASNGRLVTHGYALAVEGSVTRIMLEDHGVDPSLTALVQELIGSKEPHIAELAMALMSAQARFVEGHRSGAGALLELPAELFDDVLEAWKVWAVRNGQTSFAQTEASLRAKYDESSTRLGLLNRLLSSIGASAQLVCEIETAGLAIFASAIAKNARQPRDLVLLSCQEHQSLRLALALKAADLPSEVIAQQFGLLSGDVALPDAFDAWNAADATAMLASSPLGGAPGDDNG